MYLLMQYLIKLVQRRPTAGAGLCRLDFRQPHWVRCNVLQGPSFHFLNQLLCPQVQLHNRKWYVNTLIEVKRLRCSTWRFWFVILISCTQFLYTVKFMTSYTNCALWKPSPKCFLNQYLMVINRFSKKLICCKGERASFCNKLLCRKAGQ